MNSTRTVYTPRKAISFGAACCRVLRALDATPHPTTLADIAAHVGIPADIAGRALRTLVADGAVSRVGRACITGSAHSYLFRSIGHALPVPAPKPVPTLRDHVLDALKGGPLTTPEIVAKCGALAPSIHSALRSLEGMRLVRAVSFGRGGVITWKSTP